MKADNSQSTDRLDAAIRRRAVRAANAIIALPSAYARAEVVFVKTLDNILIGVAEPVGLRVTRDGRAGEFDTITRAKPIGTKLHPFGDDLALQFLMRNGKRPSPGSINRSMRFLDILSGHLKLEPSESLGRLLEKLKEGFDNASKLLENFFLTDQVVFGVDEACARGQLTEVFDGLEAFLNSGNHRFALRWNDDRCPRLLFFHRYIERDGRPAFQLNLLRSQAAYLDKLIGPGTGATFEEDAVQAFTPGDAWIVEDSLLSGVSAWVHWPWQTAPTAPQASLVSRAVTALALGRSPDDGGDGDSIMPALVTPIHVDGLPWLALAAVLPEGSQEDAWPQDFYRELLPYLTTTVRNLAEKAYLGKIRLITRACIDKGRASPIELTKSLQPLVATFPYKKIILSAESDHDMSEEINWQNGKAFLSLQDLSQGRARVEYTRLETSQIIRAINDGEQDAESVVSGQLQARLRSYVDIGHSLKNIVSCTGWAAAVAQVIPTNKQFDRAAAAGFEPDYIADLRSALGYAARSLSLFWLVESLGQFIRLAGAKTGNFHFSKFVDWVDLRASDETDVDEFLRAYADATFALAVSIAYGMGWSRVRVRTDRHTTREWTGLLPQPLDVRQLHIPPFKRGSDGGYIFAFCALEPLVNAIRALGELPEENYDGVGPAWLDIHVAHDLGNDAIALTVINLSRRSLPDTLSGLESAKKIVQELRVGTFDEPASERLRSDLHRVTTVMRFTAQNIARDIRNAWRDATWQHRGG